MKNVYVVTCERKKYMYHFLIYVLTFIFKKKLIETNVGIMHLEPSCEKNALCHSL